MFQRDDMVFAVAFFIDGASWRRIVGGGDFVKPTLDPGLDSSLLFDGRMPSVAVR